MSLLKDILHELASVTGRNSLHKDIDDLDTGAKDVETVAEDAKTGASDVETLTEGGK
jgi:hypothetical protein